MSKVCKVSKGKPTLQFIFLLSLSIARLLIYSHLISLLPSEIRHWTFWGLNFGPGILRHYVSVKSKLQHAPPGHTPGIWHLCRLGEEEIWSSNSSRGWGIWSKALGWGIWTPPSISCKIFGAASYHGGRGVRGFSWKRLCLCGQLLTRKGLKQALCHIWSI